ncbi:hypothetical protein [Mucilaginibacter sp.]
MELNNQNTKKQYQQPEIKDLGKIGEVTNTTATSGANGDGAADPFSTSYIYMS